MMVYNIEEVYTSTTKISGKVETDTFLGWLHSSKDENFGKRFIIKKQQSLIDHFIQSDPKIQPVKGVLNDLDVEKEFSSVSQKKVNHFVSETLAKIYHQQKKYTLAIQTYEQLSLVYPEKSAYFATLIDKIEKEQENK